MCFSATGSFALAGFLTAVGAVSVARTKVKLAGMVALIPLLFAFQQVAEGIVWRTFATGAEGLRHAAAVNVFLGFALVIWPTWLPVSLFRIESEGSRRRLLGRLVLAGLAVSAIGIAVLIHWQPQAQLAGHSIRYDYGLNVSRTGAVVYFLLYLVPAVAPFLVSTLAFGRTIGSVLLVAMVTSLLIKQDTLTSVWCFFAAIISVLIVIALHWTRGVGPARVTLSTSAPATP